VMGPFMRRSREILELFNYYFVFALQGILVRFDYVKQKLEFLLTRGRYLRRKDVFGNHGRPGLNRGPADGFETRSPCFPMHYVGERTGGHGKRRQVAGNVEGLHAVLSIVFVIRISPAAHFHIELAEMLISSPVVKGIETQDRCGFQMGDVAGPS
jgi:hypothetical protein